MRGERRLLIDEGGRLPGDAGLGKLRAHRADELLGAVGEALVAREDVEPPEAGGHLPRRQDGGRAGCGGELGDHRCSRRGIGDRGDRGVASADVLPAERLGDLA